MSWMDKLYKPSHFSYCVRTASNPLVFLFLGHLIQFRVLLYCMPYMNNVVLASLPFGPKLNYVSSLRSIFYSSQVQSTRSD
jgi:hypothetical protein